MWLEDVVKEEVVDLGDGSCVRDALGKLDPYRSSQTAIDMSSVNDK
jgi:hypothetical protein